MIAGMPRPRPPHLHRQVTRHGKAVWYVRIGKGPRVRIHAAFGSPEFDAQYQAAIPRAECPRAVKEAVGSLAWLIARYRETTPWAALAAATRKQRENIFTRNQNSGRPAVRQGQHRNDHRRSGSPRQTRPGSQLS